MKGREHWEGEQGFLPPRARDRRWETGRESDTADLRAKAVVLSLPHVSTL